MARLNVSGARKKRPLRRLAFGAAIAVAAAVFVLQTSPQIAGMFDPVRTATSDRLAGGERQSLWARISGSATRDKRILELEAEVRELARYKAASLSMAERLEAYEDMLNLMGEPPQRGVTARVVAESDGPFSESLLANAGRAQGVEPGSIAVNEGGLVGRVVSLGEHSSRVLLVNDFGSRVPVMGEVSGLRAVLYGGRDGLGTLRDLPERGKFLAGERILTTGEGGAYPRGIVAGTLDDSREATRVRFAKDNARGGFVRLIPPPIIPAPVETPVADAPVQTAASPAQGAPR